MSGPITIYVYRQDAPLTAQQRLQQAAAHYAGGEDCWTVERTATGKPYFPRRREVHVSISHSGEYWLCALADQPVGLDLQRHQRAARAEGIARRFFHPRERAFLDKVGYGRFFDIWAAKESYVKFTGEGIGNEFSSFAVATEEGFPAALPDAQLRQLPFWEGYSLCLCAARIEDVLWQEK